MDSVGAQPSQPSGNQSGSSSNRGKITNILHPLRKQNQTKDLGHLSQEQYVAAGRIASPGPPQLELSGSPRSPLLSYSPPPIYHQSGGGSGMGKSSYFSPHSYYSNMSGQNPLLAQQQQQQHQPPPMQSGTRRSKEHSLGKGWDPSSLSRRRSRSEDNENAQQLPDSDYIPYHGPISPPAENPPFARPTGLVGYSQPFSQPQSSMTRAGGSEATSSSLIGLGLSETNQNMSRYSPSYTTMSQRSQQAGGSSMQTGRATSSSMQRGGSGGKRGGAMMGTGLPSSYTHGGNAPVEAYVPRSGALKDSLPSSMRFDTGQSPSMITSSGTWPFRRDPFYPGQSQAGPSTQQRTAAFPTSSAQSRDMKAKGSSSTMNSTRRTGVGANSASSSPLIANISMHRQDSSVGSSSEGHTGSFATTPYPAPTKGHGSASTSLTSLRDGSVSLKASGSGARGTSFDQKSLPRTSMQQQRIQHRKVDSRSTINSQATRPSISDREAETSIKDAKGKSTTVSRSVGGPESVRSVPSSDGFGSASDASMLSERVNLQPGELVTSRFIQTLSPVAASSSGGTGQLSQSERFEPASASISQTWSEALSPSAQPRTPFTSSSPSRVVEEQPQPEQVAQPAITEETHTATGTENFRRDAAAEAHRRFTLLQQLHLDELTSHAPEAGGWLEPKNGCERVLMPRPTLRGGMSSLDRYDDEAGDGYHSEGGQALRRSTRAAQRSAAFERNRRMPAAYPRNSEHDAGRTQALLAQNQADTFGSANGRSRPFFHHRMPPAIPSDGNDEHAGPSDQRPWVMTDEMPVIPVRTSSRLGHRRRAQSSANAARGPSTPALTPNLMSDSDDEDIPDSSMVLAQGRALEQEREKWREQHRKSFGANDPSYRRSQSQHRKSNRSSGKKPAPKDKAGLRQAKSTPDLREKSKEKEAVPPPMPHSPPPTTSCFPRSKKHGTDQQQRLDSTRSRSKSMEGLSRLRASALAAAASFAAPCGGQSTSYQRRESEKDAERRRSKAASRRGRTLTLSRYDAEKRASLPSDDRIVYDRPFIIRREMDDKNTSPGLGKGPLQVRHPSWYVASTSANRPIEELRLPPPQATRSTVDQFGAAISSPRPNLGLANPQNKSQEDLATTGRHATKKGYHRPSNSDQLAAYLNSAAANRTNVQTGQSQPASSAASSSKERDLHQEQRPASQSGEAVDDEEKRGLSLGMSRVLGSAIDPDQATNLRPTPDSEILMRSRPHESLPVPPRRQRTSSTPGHSSISPSISPQTDQDGQPSNVDVGATPKMTSTEASKSGKVGIPHSPFTSLQTGFTAQSGAFQTPPLVQPVDDGDWFGSQGSHSRSQDRSVDRIRANTLATSSPLRSTQREARQQSTPLRGAHVPASLLDEQDFEASNLQRSHSSSGRISSDDTASQHSREMLWNTDEHGDEAFNSLFFRKPSQSLSRDLSGLTSIYSNTSTTPVPDRRLSNVNLPNQSSSTNRTAENLFDEESPNQEEMERGQREYQGEEVGDVTQTSIAHDSSTHPADTTIERMMGNLLRFQSQSRASMDRSTRLGRDSALDDTESAWNESSIGDHYAPPQGSINIGGIRAAENPAQSSSPSAPVSRIDQILSMRLGRVHGGKQPQIQGTQYDDPGSSRPNTRLRDRADTGLSDVNDEGEEEEVEDSMMEDDRSSSQMTHEIMPRETQRPSIESFAASVLMYPSSEQSTQPNSPEQEVKRQLEAEEEARTGFIDFASPAAPRPLSLADEIATGSILQQTTGPSPSGSHLAPPSAWQTNVRQSPASSGSDSGSDQHVQGQRLGANAPTQSRRESDGIMNMVRSRVWPTPPNPSSEFPSDTPYSPSADDSANQRG
ncbi:uncharacterized protein FA14DRAFT_153401 [Meira miltonrushii]|uniref:Uncharacterized protein n=1 Tax=Meira miltonrushii TaxID=1280837 RepID=A0A316VKD7_9BASI|nr:uncharacterized protein FA14DRAFT_153401 [Meira miltonrushii]PWN38062.1 hypothetical protein FA14DRAFT_153401 [Meira miltonrushii]